MPAANPQRRTDRPPALARAASAARNATSVTRYGHQHLAPAAAAPARAAAFPSHRQHLPHADRRPRHRASCPHRAPPRPPGGTPVHREQLPCTEPRSPATGTSRHAPDRLARHRDQPPRTGPSCPAPGPVAMRRTALPRALIITWRRPNFAERAKSGAILTRSNDKSRETPARRSLNRTITLKRALGRGRRGGSVSAKPRRRQLAQDAAGAGRSRRRRQPAQEAAMEDAARRGG